jgi:hypothetical protein
MEELACPGKECIMNKYILVAAITLSMSGTVAQAANTASTENPVVKGSKAVGRGLMWGPKKIGAGMKAMGEKTKDMFHHK